MKTTLLTLFFSLIFSQINGQCSENVTNFGNNTSITSYNISGNVSVTLNTNNTVTLNLASNFKTASGPDVRAYLVNRNGKTDAQLRNSLINNLDNFQFGLINSSGAQTFTVAIPSGKDITKFDTVFFYCLQFNAFWDFGSITPFNNNTCSVLSVKNTVLEKTKVYPNPAKNKIHIENIEANSAEIRIFNVLGKQVFYQKKNKKKP
ncbi:DM13 domain-containing protein [Polaribacter batillariae]|uniref:DM13 domain-containing protein n=1 Tax=Polaribacter batillariae TaxID=2808900 RepID=A0ABX7T168_9FLAO|nr:DM13 domain-containing protein [Polaribacter batillariae]QTD38818.1 DM13 domain-containing protein [Polaribacter batillariae]